MVSYSEESSHAVGTPDNNYLPTSSRIPCTGYDTLPIDSMQGLEIGSVNGIGASSTNHGNGGSGATNANTNGAGGLSVAPNSPYGMVDMDVGDIGAGELLEAMPSPPHDNAQVAAWYDTDL